MPFEDRDELLCVLAEGVVHVLVSRFSEPLESIFVHDSLSAVDQEASRRKISCKTCQSKQDFRVSYSLKPE